VIVKERRKESEAGNHSGRITLKEQPAPAALISKNLNDAASAI